MPRLVLPAALTIFLLNTFFYAAYQVWAMAPHYKVGPNVAGLQQTFLHQFLNGLFISLFLVLVPYILIVTPLVTYCRHKLSRPVLTCLSGVLFTGFLLTVLRLLQGNFLQMEPYSVGDIGALVGSPFVLYLFALGSLGCFLKLVSEEKKLN